MISYVRTLEALNIVKYEVSSEDVEERFKHKDQLRQIVLTNGCVTRDMIHISASYPRLKTHAKNKGKFKGSCFEKSRVAEPE